jgi:hypothetical protein
LLKTRTATAPTGKLPRKKKIKARGGGGEPNYLSSVPPGETGPEYSITGISVTYKLDQTEVKSLQIPERASYQFDGWKIQNLNAKLNDTELKVGEFIFPDEFQFRLTHKLSADDPYEEFPKSALLTQVNGAYITISASFSLDPLTAESVEQLKDLVDQINELALDSEITYVSDYVVGNGGDSSAEALELNNAVKAANEAITGTEVTITVPIDEYETDEDGNYVYYDKTTGTKVEINGGIIPENAELKQLTTDVTYVNIDKTAVDDAISKLQNMLSQPKYQHLEGYAQSSAVIDAKVQDYRSIVIAHKGKYKIEIHGASGGHVWNGNGYPAYGGHGGHVVVEKEFNAGDMLYARVGKEGGGTAKLNSDNTLGLDGTVVYHDGKAGGWPNGGNGGSGSGSGVSSTNRREGGAGGGGATEVYYAGSYGMNVKPAADLARADDIVLVAGGGGGAGKGAGNNNTIKDLIGNKNVTSFSMNGGNAGAGELGDDGVIPATYLGAVGKNKTYEISTGALSAPYEHIVDGTYNFRQNVQGKDDEPVWYGAYVPNGKYSAGRSPSDGGNGAKGADRGSAWEGKGGGGGGYYGGNAISDGTVAGSGGGGSNYVKSGYDAAAGSNSVSNRYGDGSFSIEYVSE